MAETELTDDDKTRMHAAYNGAKAQMDGTNNTMMYIDTLVNLGTFTALVLMDVYTMAYFTSFTQRAQPFKRFTLMAWLILMTCLAWGKPEFIFNKFPICHNHAARQFTFGLAYMLFIFVMFADPLLGPLSTGQTELGDLKNYPFAVPIKPKSFYKGMLAVNITLGAMSLLSILVGLYLSLVGRVMKDNTIPGEEMGK